MIGTPNSDGVLTLLPEETGTLETAIRAVYECHPRPRETDLCDHLVALTHELPAGLAARLAPYVGDGVYAGLLDGLTTVTPDAPLEIFNFYRLPQNVVPLAMMLLIEYLWSVIYRTNQRTLVVMDEGWSLLNQPASARFVAEATRRGQHHGIATLNMSQSIEDYMGDLGRAVINNAAASVLLSQSSYALPMVREVFGLTDGEAQLLSRLKTHKRVGAGAYFYAREGADTGSVQLYVTPMEYWLFTSDRAERELRQRAVEKHDGDVWAAVTELARTGGRIETAEDVRPRLAFAP